MTTPENFRRRQRIEGIALILLGLFTVGSTAYFEHQYQQSADDQRDCISKVTSRIIEVQAAGRAAAFVAQDATAELLRPALRGQLRDPQELRIARRHYEHQLARAQRLRVSVPLPPDPREVCQ